MNAATAVLVHGPCGTPAVWSRMIPFLDDVGVPNVAVHLPSSLPASELDDGAYLRSVLDGLDGPTVLVGHSGGGFPITQAGDHPAVRHLVYLDGALPDVGETLADLLEPGDVDESFAACINLIPRRGRRSTPTRWPRISQDRGWPAPGSEGVHVAASYLRASPPRCSRSPWRVGARCPPPSSDTPTARLEAKRGHDSHHAQCTRSRSPVTTSRCGDDPERSPRSSPASPRTPSPSKGAGDATQSAGGLSAEVPGEGAPTAG